MSDEQQQQQQQPQGGGAANEALNSPPPAPAFYETFQDPGAKEYAAKAGFKSPEDVVKLAQKFDAFKDADPASLRTLPKTDDPNAVVSFAREHLGAPADPTAYGIDKLEGADPKLAGQAQAWFHEAGLTPFQAQHIVKKQMEFMQAQLAEDVKEEKASAERELTQLQTDLGPTKYTETLELGRRALKFAAQKAGLDSKATEQFVSYLESGVGVANAIKIASVFGSFVREGDFVDGSATDSKPLPLAERMYADIP